MSKALGHAAKLAAVALMFPVAAKAITFSEFPTLPDGDRLVVDVLRLGVGQSARSQVAVYDIGSDGVASLISSDADPAATANATDFLNFVNPVSQTLSVGYTLNAQSGNGAGVGVVVTCPDEPGVDISDVSSAHVLCPTGVMDIAVTPKVALSALSLANLVNTPAANAANILSYTLTISSIPEAPQRKGMMLGLLGIAALARRRHLG